MKDGKGLNEKVPCQEGLSVGSSPVVPSRVNTASQTSFIHVFVESEYTSNSISLHY